MPGLDRTSFATSDPEAAREAFAPLVPRLQFGRVDPDAFRVWMRTQSIPGFSVVDYAFEASAAVEAGADQVLVVSPTGRGIDLRHGARPIDVSRPYINATEGVTARWDHFAARAVVLDRIRLEEVARSVSGRPDLRLEPLELAARSPVLGRYWDAAVARVARAMLAAPEAFAEPVVVEAAFHRLAVTYLNAFPLAWADGDGRRVPVGARSSVVRAALDHLHAHAGEPITVQHVADAVHISTRGLHAAFVGETGRSPSDHLRGIRLAGVRDELRFAEPAESIAGIARRWGFVHLPRFADAYQRAFGELPSETRGRRRRVA
ncbi:MULTISPECIES: helix-turn-helix transcriptional regulator [unclassified Agromyces]|uniref:helix-turn-helix transcriptional regulator n=1 Tax=unclassified Agromyces TaxID=2639701 RepID=UPI0030149EA9